ncbi:hypothetical protein BGZ96_003931 [Linnemannia gamsii]|uniref:HCP-like protein n=1 Tax=Linnemannia gamsii TaxID=64522 RepID=A0ABQ7KF03_9FUNG|nr:hypothetical protein BGZ96_003931 [Linnemannia gamsii]
MSFLPLRIIALPSVVLDVLVEDPVMKMDAVARILPVAQPTSLPIPLDDTINEDIAHTIIQAVHGDIHAQKTLTMAFLHGSDGLSQSYELASKWHLRAAEQGDSLAQLRVGSFLKIGQGPQDYAAAAAWYLKAANQGDATAQVGLGVLQEYSKALEWYSRAAQRGLPDAMVNLGIVYARDWGVPEDRSRAVEWFIKAAYQGNVVGETLLGLAYLHGHGVLRDVDLAIEWFLKAASQGCIGGQDLVGMMYATGLSVAKDYTSAMELYLKAANRGHLQARKSFEDLKTKGYGAQLVLKYLHQI